MRSWECDSVGIGFPLGFVTLCVAKSNSFALSVFGLGNDSNADFHVFCTLERIMGKDFSRFYQMRNEYRLVKGRW